MAMTPLALMVRTPEVDLVGTLRAAAQIRQAETQTDLGELKLRHDTERYGALQAFAQNKDVSTLGAYPDAQAEAIKAQGMMRTDTAEQFGRAAQHLLSTTTEDSPQREAGKQDALARLYKAGHATALQYQALSNQPATDAKLKSIMAQAMPLQATELPKLQEVREQVDKYGVKQKIMGIFDPYKQKITEYNGPSGVPVTSGAITDLTGEALLKALDPGDRAQVEAILEGRQSPPSPNARNARTQKIMEWVAQADPTFDMVNFGSRAATRKDFTSGKSARNLTSFNRVVQHMGELEEAINQLDNTGYKWWNYIANTTRSSLSDDFNGKLRAYDITRDALARELETAFRGSGGSVTGIEEWRATMNMADGPVAQRAGLKKAAKLLYGAVDAVGDQYNRGMGTTKDPLDLLAPKTRTEFKRMLGGSAAKIDYGPLAERGAQQQPPAQAAPNKQRYRNKEGVEIEWSDQLNDWVKVN